MKKLIGCIAALACANGALAAECSIAEETKALDPVEVGFCQSDAVFVGKVSKRFETIRAFTEEGSERTKHFSIELSTVDVAKSFKGAKPADKLTMTTNLYDKKTGAYSFKMQQEYLVFAKRVQGKDEWEGASANCSVQPSLPLAEAKSVLDQLEQHRKGTKKIDCAKIRKK
jgi:hypothetical protein